MINIEKIKPIVERVDDIPLIYGLLEKMGVQETVDNEIKAHGNWQGLSHGWIITLWLVHILSEQSHTMEPVQQWVSRRISLLEKLTGETITELDFADDRLAACLRELDKRTIWYAIEEKMGQRTIRVYELETGTMRLDATTGTVYHALKTATLFQVGKAKNGLYETQFKLMMACLDPLGFGLAVDVEAGNRADDPLYIPCYKRAKKVLNRNGILTVGDSKMSAFATRAAIQAGNDFYLVPLADKKDEPKLLKELLTKWLEEGAVSTPIFLPEELPSDGSEPDPALSIAHAFEVSRTQTALEDDVEVSWTERLLVVRSYSYMKSEVAGLQKRIEKAEKALLALTPPRQRGKKQIQTEEELLLAIEQIEKKYRVQGFFTCDYEREVEERSIRAYKEQAERVERKVRYQLSVQRNHDAIKSVEFAAGWRIYATNAPEERLSLTQAVLTYRGQITQENIFRRLHGKFLSITPLYVQRDDHARGLINLLTIAARVLALGDYVAREALAESGQELAGIYSGNSKRSSARPTTERMLKAFEGIDLILFTSQEQADAELAPSTAQLPAILTGWNSVHDRILEILGLSPSLYSRLISA